MKRILSIFLGLILIFSFISCEDNEPQPQELNQTQILNNVSKSVVLINAYGLFGSGVIINQNKNNENENIVHIITNYHVIKNAIESKGQVLVQFYDDDEFINAQTLGYVLSYDIVVLEIKLNKNNIYPIMDLSFNQIQMGLDVFALGYNNLQLGIYDGIVSTIDKLIYSNEVSTYIYTTQTTAPYLDGCSGGLMIDSKGNFIGLLSYALISNSNYTGLTYSIPTPILNSAYKRIISSELEISKPITGFNINLNGTITVNTSDFAFEITIYKDKIKVSESFYGSIKKGDIIKKINGKDLNSADKITIFLSEILLKLNLCTFTLG